MTAVGATEAPPAGGARRPSPAARVLTTLVRGYRALPRLRPPSCRFDPTCSGYALGAVRTHGAVRGGALAVRRLARCHPWGGLGYDPVPPRPARRRSVVPDNRVGA
ncbi:MAG TPA: membrane protein insertion efficiency factor YidD [Acidimicrobiaceae bacterium]|nr:membrane protein insertion efficiency factor YidD [Acidimicrobiaceae bacterium]HCB37242.1 membrane protein insertion efficiency factor YidD [Acidimicrobiaceae bacterium]